MYYLSRSLTSHINFDPMTKTKSSCSMHGFRPRISNLEEQKNSNSTKYEIYNLTCFTKKNC